MFCDEGGPAGLDIATYADVNTFRHIRNGIDFVADACIAAKACEM